MRRRKEKKLFQVVSGRMWILKCGNTKTSGKVGEKRKGLSAFIFELFHPGPVQKPQNISYLSSDLRNEEEIVSDDVSVVLSTAMT